MAKTNRFCQRSLADTKRFGQTLKAERVVYIAVGVRNFCLTCASLSRETRAN